MRSHRTTSLRILELLTYYLPHRTGLTLHVQRLAEELARRGHRVTVLSARFKADLPRSEAIAGVAVRRLSAPLRISRGMLMPGYPVALSRLVRRHDVVHAHSPLLELPLVALACRLARRPLVVTHHGDLVLPAGAFNRAVERLVFACYRLGVGRADKLVAYSDDYAAVSRYLRPWKDKVVAIPPPVEVPVPQPQAVSAWRARLAGGEGPVVAYAGRFVEEKRPDLLLKAMPEVRRHRPGAVVAFAGQQVLPYERYLERCRALIEEQREHVHFAGLLENPAELAAFYAAADVLVLPSESECFGLVQVEAMLCGTPVVATDIPGARVPVRATGMGVLVPPRDAGALARGIVTALDERARLVRPRAEIEALYAAPVTVDRVEALLRRVVRP